MIQATIAAVGMVVIGTLAGVAIVAVFLRIGGDDNAESRADQNVH